MYKFLTLFSCIVTFYNIYYCKYKIKAAYWSIMDSNNQEDIEVRLTKELSDIKVQLQELKSMLSHSESRFKIAIMEHQTQCPMMHKRPLLEGQSYEEWKKCQAIHAKETGRSFDVAYDRIKKLMIVAGAAYIIASGVNWAAVISVVK